MKMSTSRTGDEEDKHSCIRCLQVPAGTIKYNKSATILQQICNKSAISLQNRLRATFKAGVPGYRTGSMD
jgi:hypothetical protein